MSTGNNKATKYRHRAEELRTLAEDWMDARAKRMILEIANDYERMAETVSNLRLVSGRSGS